MEQVLPDTAPRPPNKAIIDRRVRPILRWQVAPATAGFQHVHDAVDHAAVINSLLASHIGRQKWLNPRPLLVRKPIQIRPHANLPESETVNRRFVDSPRGLLGFGPSYRLDSASNVFQQPARSLTYINALILMACPLPLPGLGRVFVSRALRSSRSMCRGDWGHRRGACAVGRRA